MKENRPFQEGKYDAWLHWYVTMRCFLDCEYCATPDRAHGLLEPIRIAPLLKTLEATGLVFRISFTGGGEPFLVPNLTAACQALVARHYISFNTNLVHKSVGPAFAVLPPERILQVHASCHIQAMERSGLVDLFAENYRLCRQRGIPIHAEEVGHPALVPEADRYRDLFRAKGVDLHFGAFAGSYRGQNYPDAYTDGELAALRLERQARTAHVTHHGTRVFMCNAGYNAAIVQPNGDIFPCDHIRKRMGNIYEKIEFFPRMRPCPVAWCTCPLYDYDPMLFAAARGRNRWHNFVQTQVAGPGGALRDSLAAAWRALRRNGR